MKPTRRNFLKTAGVVAASASVLPKQTLTADTPKKSLPNIIFILADDLGYGDLQCLNPKSQIPTPNFDRIAKRGITFTDAHSGSAVCTPTRYGVITGRYCWRTRLKRGVLGGYSRHLIDPKRYTVAKLLKDNGYSTACIGKWHLGMDFAGETHRRGRDTKNVDYSKPIQNGPNANGFEYFYGITASLDFPPYVYVENDRVTEAPTKRYPGSKFPIYLRPGEQAASFKHIETLDHFTKKATNHITAHANKDKPFFLYFPLTSPHKPCLPAKRFQGKSGKGAYGDFIMQTDWTIGQILKALDDAHIADNTLLIITSDNGSYMKRYTGEQKGHIDDHKVQGYNEKNHTSNHVFRGTKADIFEGGHHVPYLACWPAKIKPATKCDATICLTDLMATAADITSATLPKNSAEDSFSTLPLMLGKTPKTPRPPVIHHSANGSFSIRQGKWKLICTEGSGGRAKPKGKPFGKPYQLYDMSTDISERKNVAAGKPEVVKKLIALLDKIRKSGNSKSL